ncbi:DUF5011 domain-containing protein [Paenibacillus psychroresistens]|uniref:DUF5011 domain-containing protein n=1 Tax=Paenibacillus psychroresistens TaxID=1778678 RepID=A0A6B8RTT6_9BACL|nr:immunoglobulin-like domain-containing protein [Paenibacillus psychroresistens]QGQ98985.1 DUF5011 domain-containing protein [Paenibacillus psychroresistens]
MINKLRLLTCLLLICVSIPVNLTFADPPSIDREGDGIHIDDIVFYNLSHSGDSLEIRNLLDQIVPIVAPNGGPGPVGYTFCAYEGGTCSFSGTAIVAFGAEAGEVGNKVGYYSYKNFRSTTSCDNGIFGDPIGGVQKSCYYLNVADTTSPVLTMTGELTVNLTYGASYVDLGATAIDDFDGNLTGSIAVTVSNNVNEDTTLNTSVAGTYTYHYNVNDLTGNHANEIKRTVVVAAETSTHDPLFNIAIGATATALTTYEGYSAAKINDGSNDTSLGQPYSWTNLAVPALPQWIELDWGVNNKTFNRVELYTSSGYEIRDYQILYWNGSSWVDLFTAETGNTSVHRTHIFTTVTSSKIRVVGNSGPSGQLQHIRVNELEVYLD